MSITTENERDIEKEVERWLIQMFLTIGIATPYNVEDIQNFIIDDVKETADPQEYHNGDFAIAFRRFLERES